MGGKTMTYELNHGKIREEMEKYIVQMKATEFVKDDYLSKAIYVELLKAVIQIEHINLDYRVKQLNSNGDK